LVTRLAKIGLVLLLWRLLGLSAEAAPAVLMAMRVDAAISPGTAEFIETGIRRAEEEQAVCLVIELDTPGGLAESMRDIVKAIMGSRVPVVVYVSPSGARAASAGVMITIAADIAAMAPGTNIGAAHPVGAGGGKIDKTMSEKITNDMVAHAQSIAQRRGRNAEWVEKAVRESVSVTETEALAANIIDLVARDLDDLIAQLDGREVTDKGRLALGEVSVVRIREDLRTKILGIISDPNIAYLLMMIGLAGLYFELSHPGAIFPGVIGGICIVLAFFAFQTLPVNYAGVLLILLAIVFFIMEMKITSYGLLSVAGIFSLLLGSLMLFKEESATLRVSWQVLLPTLAIVSGFFVTVAGLVFRSHLSKPRTGARGLTGEIGVVKKAVAAEKGKVFVHGELWQATAAQEIAEGTRVKVLGMRGLVLEVAPLDAPEGGAGDNRQERS
jgi:membrane-bound serine protease (ClpP class)